MLTITVSLSAQRDNSNFGGGFNGNSNYDSNGYQGNSGTKYQYDMSNPSDRIDYSTDLDAQRRDSMYQDVGGGRYRDNSYGQQGGGVYGY